MLRTIEDSHAPNLRTMSTNGRRYYGRHQYQAFLLSILATFPDLAFQIDDLYWMGNDKDGYLTAMRWSIVGQHNGWGVYGTPTGRPIHMWGINKSFTLKQDKYSMKSVTAESLENGCSSTSSRLCNKAGLNNLPRLDRINTMGMENFSSEFENTRTIYY